MSINQPTDLEVDDPHAWLQAEPSETSTEAARKSIGRNGSWRRLFFNWVAAAPDLINSVEIEARLADLFPCPGCGCTHRAPKGTPFITSRLGELREAGWITRVYDQDGAPLTRDGASRHAELHGLTQAGYDEAISKGIGNEKLPKVTW